MNEQNSKTGRIPLEELASLPSFYFVEPSHRGDRVGFYWDKSGRMELYLLDLPAGKPYQLSHGEVPRALRAGFVWSRDGRRIVFAKDEEGNEQHDLYAIDTQSGLLHQITDTPQAQEFPLEFSPDDQWLTMASNRDGQLNLYKIRPDGSEIVTLTEFGNPVLSGGIWDREGKRIAFTVNETADLRNQDIYLVNTDGSGLRRLLQVKPGSQEAVVEWLPTGRHLAITSDASGVNRPGILDIEAGSVRWLGEGEVEETAVGVSKDGKWFLTLRNQDATIRAILYEIQTGKAREIELPIGVVSEPKFVLHDSALLMSYTSTISRPEMVIYELESGRKRTVLPAEYGSIDPRVFRPERYITYRSFDGLEIPALLYTPQGQPGGERLPAIVIVHGGPTWQFFRGFDPFAQFLVNRGFVVLEPNIRGSTGYGVEFRDLNLRDWGGGDLEDVAAGAEYLKTLPLVDPERIGIFGGSYGGYMTFMQAVKKPNLWKAAVAWIGITDLNRMYKSSMEHFKYFLRWQMGNPQENATLWKERSAINYAGNLQAKLLIVHGANDPRCPVEQARIFRDKLLELGYKEGEDFEYREFADEGHGSTDIAQKIRAYKLLADFMERRL
jgi:dipeptidyl aminopeptidase/acylaminoacyl peptidase